MQDTDKQNGCDRRTDIRARVVVPLYVMHVLNVFYAQWPRVVPKPRPAYFETMVDFVWELGRGRQRTALPPNPCFLPQRLWWR